MTFAQAAVRRSFFTFVIFLAFAGPVLAQDAPTYVEGEVIVTFKPQASLTGARTALRKRSLNFERHYPRLSERQRKATGLVRKGGRKTQELIQELKDDPLVESVEPNYLRKALALPTDPRMAELWGLKNTGQTVFGIRGTAGADIKFEEAWAKARPSNTEIVVAVLDTGVDFTHPELASRMWTNTLEIPNNNIDDDGNGYKDDYYGYDFADGTSDPSDIDVHGTHIAGTIAAQGNNDEGVVGLIDKVKIMALKISSDGDTMSTSAILDALEYAVNMKERGVNLVALNASYGGSGYSNAERTSIIAAGQVGIILVAAAGNDGLNNNSTATYPASYGLSNIITVAASDQNDNLASFSNYGSSTVDLAAPGANIVSTAPNGLTLKVGTTSYITLAMTYSGVSSGLTGSIHDCGLGFPTDFPTAVQGNIALISRGTLTFADKAANAKAAGAAAVIVYNNEPGLFLGTLGESGNWLPVLAMSQQDGFTVKAALPVSGSLVATPGYQILDGTSMATPHVVGAVAFAAMNFPLETVTQRKARIINSVDVKPGLQGKVRTGGRLNLNRVVDANLDGIPDWSLSFHNNALLAGGIVGQPYEETLTLVSGQGLVSYSLTAGALPAGLSLNSNGFISGTPETAGNSSFTISAVDANGSQALGVFTLGIAAEAPLITTTGTLPEAVSGVSYTHALTATGGTSPYQWNVSAGSLPAGLTLSSAGQLTGIMDEAGTFSFTVKLTDAYRLVHERTFELTILPSPITISNAASLPYAVKGETYRQDLLAEGGTPFYKWNILSGSLPPGLRLSDSGVFSGKPTQAGNFQFRLKVTDHEGTFTSKPFSLAINATYTTPVLEPLVLDSAAVGVLYSGTVKAAHYPRSYKVSGLPKGLKYSSSTGLISGRPKEAGDFLIVAKATNKAGTSTEVSTTLTVRAVNPVWIGSFAGIVRRSTEANKNLGSRFVITTTKLGSFSVQVTTGSTRKSAKGFLAETTPQLNAMVHGHPLSLTLDPLTGAITGTHGNATVEGWAAPWSSKNLEPGELAGYYTTTLKIVPQTDGEPIPASLPHGIGYLAFNISTKGNVTISGRNARGDSIVGSSLLGPLGEVGVYRPLYKNKGSMLGTASVVPDQEFQGYRNGFTGRLDWTKPADSSRTYGTAFSTADVFIAGGYQSPTSARGAVRGLIKTGQASLIFNGGGLEESGMVPAVASFDYSVTGKIKMPRAGSVDNPARATLSIHKSTGVVTGGFTLVEPITNLKRKATFRGILLPQATGVTRAEGYFLLPQIPASGQKSSSSPILSGGMNIFQTAEQVQ